MANTPPPPLPPGGMPPPVPTTIPYANWSTNRTAEAGRNGKLLVVPDQYNLGPNCVKCNRPGDREPKMKKFSWSPPWVFLVGGALLAAAVSKKAKVAFTLCEEHRKRRMKLMTAAWTTGLLAVPWVIGCIALGEQNRGSGSQDAFGIAAVCGGFVLLIVALVTGLMSASLKPKRIAAGVAVLTGAGEAFLATMPEVQLPP